MATPKKTPGQTVEPRPCPLPPSFPFPLAAAPAFVVLVGVVLTIVMHWDDRAGLWWKESQASQQQRDESIWLPGYRVVIDAKPLQGLEEDETSDLAYNPATRTLFTVTGKRPLLVELSLTGDVLRTIPLLGLSNPEGVAVLENGNVA